MSHQFSFFLLTTSASAASCTSLQYPTHNHISISHVSLLFLIQHHYFTLNHFKIYFLDNEFEKTIV
jgi:hypothetical protein